MVCYFSVLICIMTLYGSYGLLLGVRDQMEYRHIASYYYVLSNATWFPLYNTISSMFFSSPVCYLHGYACFMLTITFEMRVSEVIRSSDEDTTSSLYYSHSQIMCQISDLQTRVPSTSCTRYSFSLH